MLSQVKKLLQTAQIIDVEALKSDNLRLEQELVEANKNFVHSNVVMESYKHLYETELKYARELCTKHYNEIKQLKNQNKIKNLFYTILTIAVVIQLGIVITLFLKHLTTY